MSKRRDPSSESSQDKTLKTNFSFISLCGIALTTGESWIVLGNSLTLAVRNGGAPAVLYGFIVDSALYWIVALSIAEIASAVPSTATVYHWAAVAAGKHWRAYSWYAGWFNAFAWIFGVASLVSFMSLQVTGIYSVLHPNFDLKEWHIFCAFVVCNWSVCIIVLLSNRAVAMLESFGLFFIVGGWLISLIVCAAFPASKGTKYASNRDVWLNWENKTGWSSNGFAFCLGLVNAALAICAPDIPSHLSEEIPRPSRNVPVAIGAQYVASFITGFTYLVTLFYVTPNLDAAAAANPLFPLESIYLQATSRPAAAGLLIVAFIPTFIGTLGGFTIAGRQIWALARDDVTPFAGALSKMLERTQTPVNATALVGVVSTAIGAIYLGSATAFNDITASFVSLTSLSYLAVLVPYVLTRRKNIKPGYFWIPGTLGLVVSAVSALFLSTFVVIFCFPQSLPVTVDNMNYTSVIIAGLLILITFWWFVRGKSYRGPHDLVQSRQEVDASRTAVDEK